MRDLYQDAHNIYRDSTNPRCAGMTKISADIPSVSNKIPPPRRSPASAEICGSLPRSPYPYRDPRTLLPRFPDSLPRFRLRGDSGASAENGRMSAEIPRTCTELLRFLTEITSPRRSAGSPPRSPVFLLRFSKCLPRSPGSLLRFHLHGDSTACAEICGISTKPPRISTEILVGSTEIP